MGIYDVIKEQGIELFAPISLQHCRVTRQYKLQKAGFADNAELWAVILAVPYLTRQDERNVSSYAVPRDYHIYFERLADILLPRLRAIYPHRRFALFSDDSPIDERYAAAMAGLGIIGDNGLLITEKYSSYVFLGEIITDMPLEAKLYEVKRCEGCGSCRRACPKNEQGICLSALTQKKGALSESESAAIKKYGRAWGCDICQEVCPHTLKAIREGTIYSTLDFFKEDTLPILSVATLDRMDDAQFASRAYSWRKRETIRRNLLIIESDIGNGQTDACDSLTDESQKI